MFYFHRESLLQNPTDGCCETHFAFRLLQNPPLSYLYLSRPKFTDADSPISLHISSFHLSSPISLHLPPPDARSSPRLHTVPSSSSSAPHDVSPMEVPILILPRKRRRVKCFKRLS
eukprot:TRINITY_DN9315_c1_g1_i3.p1 TRINITY_DN9315_c1_g1~~TRINITY_DN9315_c1_g1_i3.p1  ORF type:complete len:116 (+),score=9.97 TRINITY_DN9315_c1_g1_i3:3-350(+)